MTRTATCVCGELSVRVEGEPLRINMCNCKDCQRRSGSAFQLGAFFNESQVEAILEKKLRLAKQRQKAKKGGRAQRSVLDRGDDDAGPDIEIEYMNEVALNADDEKVLQQLYSGHLYLRVEVTKLHGGFSGSLVHRPHPASPTHYRPHTPLPRQEPR